MKANLLDIHVVHARDQYLSHMAHLGNVSVQTPHKSFIQ